MIDEPGARERAQSELPTSEAVLGAARELEQGWFFPCITKGIRVFDGVVVNKTTGECLRIMTESALSRDPTLYDRGYQFLTYDVVVFAIHDVDATVDVLVRLHETTVDVYYKYDRVWRVGRGLNEAEVRSRIATLPAVFTGNGQYVIGDLEEARARGWFDFRVLKYRGRE